MLSIFLVRAVLPVTAEPGALMAQGDALSVAGDASPGGLEVGSDAMPAGYTTPGANSPAQRRMLDASLSHYLVAHSEAAASALRSSYDEVAEGMELTEEQSSALR